MAGIRLATTLALAGLLAGLAPALAQTPAGPPPKMKPAPYKPVTVTLPTASADASFIAFRQQLAKVAKSRVYSDLARLVVRRGFFWDRDFGGSFDPTKSGVENLAFAVSLEGHNGAGWNTLAAFAAEATTARASSRPGVVCSPGHPKFSEPDFGRLLDLTKTDGFDWLYPTAEVTAVRATRNRGSAIIDTLGRHFVRVLREHTGSSVGNADAWQRVFTPTGKVGFVERKSLSSLAPGRLCYSKDIIGRWHIAGYVGGGD